MNKRVKWIILGVLVVLICGGTALAVARARSSTVEIEASKIARRRLDVFVSASGDLAALGQKDICPKVNGTIERLPVSDGQRVRTGQVLAVIDSQPLRVVQSQAWSAYEAAKAQKDTVLRSMPLDSEIRAARSAVDQAYYAYRVIRWKWRQAPAPVKGSLKGQVKQAYAAYMQAQAGLDKLESVSNDAQLRSANAAEDQAYSAYRKASVDVANAVITAPTSGVLMYKSMMSPTGQESKISNGSGVQAGVAIFSIANLSRAEFVADVDETDVGKLKSGQKAVVTLDAFPDAEWRGVVTSIGSIASVTKSGGTSFSVKIRMPRVRQALRIGMNGNADIIRVSRQNALVVPYEAVFSRGPRNFVFVVKGSVLKERQVSLGMETDTAYEVTKGLEEGDLVARTKVSTLKDGQLVTVK